MDLELRPFGLKLKNRFRDLDVRTGLLVGSGGRWAEFSPFADYPKQLRERWARATLEALDEPWPAPVRNKVPVNVTVPAVAPELAHRIVRESRCGTAKVKVGDEGDEARVEAVRDALGASGRLRVDVNGRWDVDGAARMLSSLRRYDLEYAEQPVPTLDEMRSLRRRIDVPLAVDESLRTAADPLAVDITDAADVAVLKVAPLGGVRATIELAERLAVPIVISSALESSVGLAAGIACAAAIEDLRYACGLATAALFADDLVTEPFLPVDGAIEVRRPLVDEALLQRHALEGPEADRLRTWFQEATR